VTAQVDRSRSLPGGQAPRLRYPVWTGTRPARPSQRAVVKPSIVRHVTTRGSSVFPAARSSAERARRQGQPFGLPLCGRLRRALTPIPCQRLWQRAGKRSSPVRQRMGAEESQILLWHGDEPTRFRVSCSCRFGRPPRGIAVPAALRDLCVEQPGWVLQDGPYIANRACWRCSGGPWSRSSFVALWEEGLDPAVEDGCGGAAVRYAAASSEVRQRISPLATAGSNISRRVTRACSQRNRVAPHAAWAWPGVSWSRARVVR